MRPVAPVAPRARHPRHRHPRPRRFGLILYRCDGTLWRLHTRWITRRRASLRSCLQWRAVAPQVLPRTRSAPTFAPPRHLRCSVGFSRWWQSKPCRARTLALLASAAATRASHHLGRHRHWRPQPTVPVPPEPRLSLSLSLSPSSSPSSSRSPSRSPSSPSRSPSSPRVSPRFSPRASRRRSPSLVTSPSSSSHSR